MWQLEITYQVVITSYVVGIICNDNIELLEVCGASNPVQS